jgi:hypothetical protein
MRMFLTRSSDRLSLASTEVVEIFAEVRRAELRI